MAEKMNGCLFCARSKGVVLRSGNVFVQLDDAPIIEGHALVMPELHYPSVADVPASISGEFDQICEQLRQIYLDEYGAFAMFEHGRTGHCVRRNPGERICHHAHIHVLPLTGDLVGQVELGQRVAFQTWAEVADLAGDIDGYLIAESADVGRYFFPVTRPLPSHHLRTLAARLAGDTALADWEELMHNDRSTRLIDEASRRLVPHFDVTLSNAGA